MFDLNRSSESVNPMGDRSTDADQTYIYSSVSYQQATHEQFDQHGLESPSGYGP